MIRPPFPRPAVAAVVVAVALAGPAVGVLTVGRAPAHPAAPADAAPDDGPADASPAGDGPPGAPAPEVRWAWPTPPPGGGAGVPAVAAEGAYLVHSRHELVALDPDGAERWRRALDRPTDDAPALTDGLVVVAAEEALHAVDRATGERRWTVPTGDRATTPVVAGDRVVTATWADELVAVDLAGRPAWRLPVAGSFFGPATAHDGVVVATWEPKGPGEGGVVAVDAASGRVRWQAPVPAPGWNPYTGGGISAAAVRRGGGPPPAVVVVDGAGEAVARDLATGEERWRVALPAPGSNEVPPLALPDGRVLVADRMGGLTLVDAGGGVAWQEEGVGAAVRGGPVGPGPGTRFALPLDSGHVLLAGPGHEPGVLDPPGVVPGLAVQPGTGRLLVPTAQAGEENALFAVEGW